MRTMNKRYWLLITSLVMLLNIFLINPNQVFAVPNSIDKALNNGENWLKKNNSGNKDWNNRDWNNIALFSIQKQSFAPVKINSTDQLVISTDVQRTVLGYLANGYSASKEEVRSLVNKIKKSQRKDGKFADYVNGFGDKLLNSHIWAIISLYAAGEPIPNKDKARKWLVDQQRGDGGFGIEINSTKSDVDITAMAIMALHVLGEEKESSTVKKAIEYLHEQQLKTGGFPSFGIETAESTAIVIQALYSLEIDPFETEWTNIQGNPITALLQYQLKVGGFSHIKSKNMKGNSMATQQALIALGDIKYKRSWIERLNVQSITLKNAPKVKSIINEQVINFNLLLNN